MILHPTVVVGVGSTGKAVVSGVQKYLYEVLNGKGLNLFKFIIFETAVNQAERDAVATVWRTKPVDMKVDNIGAAVYHLKEVLGDDFAWWPDALKNIDGPGAGNKRAGGRLMFFSYIEKIAGIITEAITAVNVAAGDNATAEEIRKQLEQRGVATGQQLLPNHPVPVVIVVGTLAGGTCSGSCVDFGYLIRRIAPTSTRTGIFFLPDTTAAAKFKANSWAALSDLVYFVENPSDYKAAWVTESKTRAIYKESQTSGSEPPFRHVYLLSGRNATGDEHLTYREDYPDSPLLAMGALSIAADLLGLEDLRAERLSNHSESNKVHQTFLTSSIRGVSYPKYEISRAASCQVIARLCDSWLSTEGLEKDNINKKGREEWNHMTPAIWAGLREAIKIPELADRIRSEKITQVEEYLTHALTENKVGTLYQQVDQHIDSRRRRLENGIRDAVVEALQQKQNLKYGEWFLDGIQAEMKRARAYWQDVGIPAGADAAAWQQKAKELVARLEARYKNTSVNFFAQRFDSIQDELEQIITRLEMFLMYEPIAAVSKWADTELRSKLETLRKLLEGLRSDAVNQAGNIKKGLQDRTGPLLKISRSPDRRFDIEIDAIAKFNPEIPGKTFIDYVDGRFVGLFEIARIVVES